MKVIGNNYRGLKSIYKLMQTPKTAIVVPNWNGKDSLSECLDSLLVQTQSAQIIVVDNGSLDGSADFVEKNYPKIILVRHTKNLGFTGGVNAGIKKAMEHDSKYVALLNNDAVADKNWLEHLVDFLDSNPKAGIATSKICDADNKQLDSTGEAYSIWGLPFPRGRGEGYSHKHDKDTWVFGASGGASIYRIKMLKQIGLFDDDFFAYYEDVDLSFRAQLAGWKVGYEPKALVYHKIGATSSKLKGFTTYQTMKNLPQVLLKNVPRGLFWRTELRFELAYWSFFFSALSRGQGWPALKGYLMALLMIPKKLWQRHKIQKSRSVSIDYIDSIMVHDLPPAAHKLRVLRAKWWKFAGKTG
jgi:GT2 family glycosyltransferase